MIRLASDQCCFVCNEQARQTFASLNRFAPSLAATERLCFHQAQKKPVQDSARTRPALPRRS